MKLRELRRNEWADFFNSFSRRYGQPVTVELAKAGAEAAAERAVAREMPLMGITAEAEGGAVRVIEIMLGESPGQHLTHVVNAPSRVNVGGEDDRLVIEFATDPVTRIHFAPASTLAEQIAKGSAACRGSRQGCCSREPPWS
jgi:Family of unknown function (DUF5335)